MRPPDAPTFEVRDRTEPSETVVSRFSTFSLAGLTAVGRPAEQLGLLRHRPRAAAHAATPDPSRATVPVIGLFVPVRAEKSFADAVLSWTDTDRVEGIPVLSEVPGPRPRRARRVLRRHRRRCGRTGWRVRHPRTRHRHHRGERPGETTFAEELASTPVGVFFGNDWVVTLSPWSVRPVDLVWDEVVTGESDNDRGPDFLVYLIAD